MGMDGIFTAKFTAIDGPRELPDWAGTIPRGHVVVVEGRCGGEVQGRVG